MTEPLVALSERLKRLGYAKGMCVRIYGQEFDLISDPLSLHDNLVVVDGVERRSGETRRIRLPLPILRMIAHREHVA